MAARKAARMATSVLPKAGIPADEPVHGLVEVHVEIHVLDGAGLVGRLLVLERRGKLLVVSVDRRECMPLQGVAGGVEGHQILGDLLDGLLDAPLGRFPGRAAQFVDPGVVPVGPDVALDLVESMDGDVEPVAGLVLHEKKIVFDRPHGEPLETLVDSNPVVRVDDEVAFVELPEGLEEIALARPGGAAPARLLPEDLLFTEDNEPKPRQGEARAQASLRAGSAGRPSRAAASISWKKGSSDSAMGSE